ncbi:unnamed protein product [Miscanthus lutarioriparius]|uniref:Polygalacturonase n=1 Tax=Miscanthus lutarioriparius TaxID=422564 RepID=A0A811Q0X7_9POAL|nr:unnamed protein product [Miscanthus lutarioriparius]
MTTAMPLCRSALQVVLTLVVVLAAAARGSACARGELRDQAPPGSRPHSVTITEFGAVGDGRTLNTVPFQNAVFYVRSFADKGGAQLYVPRGRWVTGSFNLTSHLTLYLEQGAVIVGVKDSSQWPIVEPLPSYGQGTDLPGPRHRSLISGYNLTDVVITGNNGVIDGQGLVWWQWLRSHELNHSRPHILEFLYSEDIVISNLTFLNSPAWSIHPVYCSNVKVHNVTIETSLDAPLTDGIVPDSCSNLCIEDSTISVSHEAISLKSGWDKYGISFGRPTSDIRISRVDLLSSSGAALAFGSQMSGGISDIHVNHLRIHDSYKGISFKTSPDDSFDLSDLPTIDQVTMKNMVGTNISVAGVLSGIDSAPFTAICLSNLNFSMAADSGSSSWSCSNVSGYSEAVFPEPCTELRDPSSSSSMCFSLASYSAIATA